MKLRVTICWSSLIVVALLLLSIVSTGPAALADETANSANSAAAARAADNAVKTAALALQKEFAAHLTKAASPLRAKPDFFKQNPDPAVTPKAIISALHREYGSEAASVYVHWQLLSGIEGKVSKELSTQLLAAYSDAPMGAARPGLDAEEKIELRQAVLQLPETEAPDINTAFAQRVKQWQEATKPYTAYRDALAERLPASFELVQTRFEDAVERAENGIDAGDVIESAMAAGRTWASGSDAQPDQIQSLAAEVATLLRQMGAPLASSGELAPQSNAIIDVVYAKGHHGGGGRPKTQAQFPPQFFTTVAWNTKTRGLEWKTGAAQFASAATLQAFRKSLLDQAAQTDTVTAKASNKS
jgi:hypothetical protein